MPRREEKEVIMPVLKATVIVTGLVALMGCSSSLKQTSGYIKQPEVCIDRWYGYHQGSGCPSAATIAAPDPSKEMAARLAALEQDRQRLADELEAARRQNTGLSSRVSDLERQTRRSRSRNCRTSFRFRRFFEALESTFSGTKRLEPVARRQGSARC